MAESALLDFYRDWGPDSQGRMLASILGWSDQQLEDVHDFIQWVFPTRTASSFVAGSPVLDEDVIHVFHQDVTLRDRLLEAFRRMLSFYGFVMTGAQIQPATNFDARRREWVTRYNHNFRRISRILDCLRTLGLQAEAEAFFAALEQLYDSPEGPMIGPDTFRYWRRSAFG